jgi:hypothetical protein
VIPAEAVESHWLVYRDEGGWGCTGCDWTGTLDDFWKTHGTRRHDVNIPF